MLGFRNFKNLGFSKSNTASIKHDFIIRLNYVLSWKYWNIQNDLTVRWRQMLTTMFKMFPEQSLICFISSFFSGSGLLFSRKWVIKNCKNSNFRLVERDWFLHTAVSEHKIQRHDSEVFEVRAAGKCMLSAKFNPNEPAVMCLTVN